MLKGKTIVFGICGGIAAYKMADVVSRCTKAGAEVHVIMTENSQKFIAPLTFRTLSGNPVVTDMFAEPQKWNVQHVSMAEKADLMVIAPATANIIGKMSNGIADDMLTAVFLATRAPVLIVPAMNTQMYLNSMVERNIKNLMSLGYGIMEPKSGRMACGTVGIGRLPEPEEIFREISKILLTRQDFFGKNILITAGPTREPIDPVRYISNHSSGKMGYALAGASVGRGAKVTVISGPVGIMEPAGAYIVHVETAEEMLREARKHYEEADIVIMAAAVADYKCRDVSGQKIKKSDELMGLELVRNPDISLELSRIKGRQFHVGFCAETENLLKNSENKLRRKKFDLIVANDVTKQGAGFEGDTNIVTMLDSKGGMTELPIMSKLEVAHRILDEIVELTNDK